MNDKSHLYVDDSELTELLLKEIAARKNGNNVGPSNELGEKFLLIVNKYLTKPSFSGYTKDIKNDFISSACFFFARYWHTFKESKVKKKKDGSRGGAFTFFTILAHSGILAVFKERKNSKELSNKLISFGEKEFTEMNLNSDSDNYQF